MIEAGGGLVTEPRLLNTLLTTCFVVWLKASPEKYMERVIAQGDLRPMLNRDDAMSDLRLILSERDPFYAKAHVTIDSSNLTVEECLDAVYQAIPEDIRQGD